MKQRILVIGVLLTLALAACAPAAPPANGGYPPPMEANPNTTYPPPANDGDPLAGTSWILTQLGGNPPLADVTVTLEFTDGQLGGTDGCNSFGGGYQASGETLTVSKELVSTLMACEDAIMQQASAYTAMLIQTATFKIDGEQLVLMDADGKTLATFTRQSQDLAGTSWIVTGLNDGNQGVTSSLLESEITAAFGADGQVNGSAGCNGYFAAFTTEAGGKITISAPGATKKYCNEPAGVMEQETRYLLALESAASYRISGGTLTLFATDGSTAVMLTRAQ